jgi:hypothetical protein
MHDAMRVLEEYVAGKRGEELDSGFFSTVYAIDAGHVAKVSHRGHEDGWVAWAAWCMRYKPKHGPQIYAMYLSRGNTVAIMKRYDRIVESGDYGDGPWKLQETGRVIHDPNGIGEMKSWAPVEEPRTEMGKMAYAFRRDFSAFDDVAGRNCMWDRDLECIVATDPYCRSNDNWRWSKIAHLLDGLDNVIVEVQAPDEERFYDGSRLKLVRKYARGTEDAGGMLQRTQHNGNRFQVQNFPPQRMLQMRGPEVRAQAPDDARGAKARFGDIVFVDDIHAPAFVPSKRLTAMAARNNKRAANAGDPFPGRAVNFAGLSNEALLQMVRAADEIDPAVRRRLIARVLPDACFGKVAKAKVSEPVEQPRIKYHVQQRKKRHHPIEAGWTHDPRGGHHKRSPRRARAT